MLTTQSFDAKVSHYTENTLLPIGADFSVESITVTVPADSTRFEIPQFFTIVDDDIDEDEQSFAVLAEIGPDVPDGVSCFQFYEGAVSCFGRKGATEIRITDNDRKLINLV